MDLKKELRQLVDLQKIDSQIYSLTQQKECTIPQELETLKNSFEEKKSTLSFYEEKVKQLQLKRKEKELDLASQEENIRKGQGQLYQLKTNKEYQAKLSEIGSLKADVSVLEESIIKILDEAEGVEKELMQVKENLAGEEKMFKGKQSELNERLKDIEAQIKNLSDKRSMLVKGIDEKILSRYERLIVSRSGVAIASVLNENCGACHMRVTAQKVNEIKMYKELMFCEMCARLLYTEDDLF